MKVSPPLLFVGLQWEFPGVQNLSVISLAGNDPKKATYLNKCMKSSFNNRLKEEVCFNRDS